MSADILLEYAHRISHAAGDLAGTNVTKYVPILKQLLEDQKLVEYGYGILDKNGVGCGTAFPRQKDAERWISGMSQAYAPYDVVWLFAVKDLSRVECSGGG